MGNCGSTLDCAACYSKGCSSKISAEPDIVGPGVSQACGASFDFTYLCKVLASFFLTSVITIASIIYGYVSDSLPTWYLNEVDAAILARYQVSWRSKTLAPRLWSSLKNLIRIVLRRPDKSSSKPLDRDDRTEALTRFILALSDQQLVTGLAILIGALGSRCTISSYEFLVVVSLAWFSSTTHLATLDVLREYFIQNQVVRNVRVIGMVAMMILLSFGLIVEVAYYEGSPAMPLQCAISGLSWNNDDYALSDELISTIFTILFLTVSYASRIGHLFDDEHSQNRPSYSNRERFLRLILLLRHPKLNVDADAYRRIIKEVVSEKRTSDRKKMLEKAKESMKSAPTYLVGLQGYSGSFLSNIPALLFGLSYGISQVSVVRWFNPPDMTEAADTMSFGQIVPLFLLILPALAAAEIYYSE